MAVAADAIRDVAHPRKKANAAQKKLATLTLQSEIEFASPDDRNAFAEELSNAGGRIIRKYHCTSGRRFKLILGMYPAITGKEEMSKERKIETEIDAPAEAVWKALTDTVELQENLTKLLVRLFSDVQQTV